jgi:hypothetical protein
MGQNPTHLNKNNMQQQEFSIPLWEFNKERHGWSQRQYDTVGPSKNWDGFRVVTYNIWFSDKYQPMRFKSLCDILNRSNAQIIGLQESLFLSCN